MSCVIRYREKESKGEWKYHKDGDETRCLDYIIMSEYEEDIEYEIYNYVNSGTLFCDRTDVDEYTIKDYLFDKYKCSNLVILNHLCPVDINLLDLSSPVTERFKKALENVEKQKDRNKNSNRNIDKNNNKRKRLNLHIDSRVEKTLVISEKDDQSKLSIITSTDCQDKKRNVYYLTIEDIENNRFNDDKRGIYIVNCNDILGDGRKLYSLIEEANLVTIVKDNNMTIIKDRYSNARGFMSTKKGEI